LGRAWKRRCRGPLATKARKPLTKSGFLVESAKLDAGSYTTQLYKTDVVCFEPEPDRYQCGEVALLHLGLVWWIRPLWFAFNTEYCFYFRLVWPLGTNCYTVVLFEYLSINFRRFLKSR
jgi:hypothetical protein